MVKLQAVYILLMMLVILGLGCCYYVWTLDNEVRDSEDEDLFGR